jgi:hypothetical protein
MTKAEMLIAHSENGIPVFRLDTSKNGEIWRGGKALRLVPQFVKAEA